MVIDTAAFELNSTCLDPFRVGMDRPAIKAQLELQPNQGDPWRLPARLHFALDRHASSKSRQISQVMNDMPRMRRQPNDGRLALFHFHNAHRLSRGDFLGLFFGFSIIDVQVQSRLQKAKYERTMQVVCNRSVANWWEPNHSQFVDKEAQGLGNSIGCFLVSFLSYWNHDTA